MGEEQSRFRISEGKRRVLLVEDEIVNQALMNAILGDAYEVIVAETGEKALDILRAEHDTISIVLLDLNLPGINGLEVLRRIKADPSLLRVPIIVLTADGDAEVECLTVGAIDFIPKPYPRPKVVLARIKRTIELSEDRDILKWTERDHLTGLYNKEFFYRYADQFDLFHKDAPTDAIVLDVNHFHIINERYGKEYGDKILKQIAEKALETVNETGGIVSRSEADTFMIYCPHRSDYDAIVEALSVPYGSDKNGDSRVKVRIGVYADVDKSLDIERRFDRAKMAANMVKDNYARPIGFYDHSMHETEVLSEQLIDDFPTAIREKQFAVYFQPKFDIRNDVPILSSAEALVRWKHPTLGMISPALFIPLFEKNGLIQKLDYYVWTEAAEKMHEWREKFGIFLPVSINVSRVDLYDPELADKLLNIAKKYRLTNDELLLEITESAYTEDAGQIADKIGGLRELGFYIEMDDFGTGYSSLNMLSSVPIDALKLDMLFIRNAFKGERGAQLLKTMIQLAESLQLTTIAEGVETADQVSSLKEMGCDIIQGYYFSRPLPAEEFEKFIVEKRPPRFKAAE